MERRFAVTVTLELKPDIEARVEAQARAKGLPVERFLEEAIEDLVAPREYDLDSFLALPREEQDRLLAEAAAEAAELYDADLARPVSERELTAFTVLDGEGFLDGAA